ncbi:hypothetical protein F4805DRAFT_462021 [Annulohypoxylon moriforme]|nr:hypothetical protein F4805DRAFT_462021 [Annulohypoxylon moriforme]
MAPRTNYVPLSFCYQRVNRQKPVSAHNWQDGEIAFLKDAEEFTLDEYDSLISSGYLHKKATRHPVIILEHSNDRKHFLVATVSAYSSGRENNYLPPWMQFNHKCKRREAFRAFSGSAKPFPDQKHLQLADGASFPKPETSWVYMPATFVVPASTLKEFDKTPKRLRMTEESLKDLLNDMAKIKRFATRWINPCVARILESREPKTQKCWQTYNRWV